MVMKHPDRVKAERLREEARADYEMAQKYGDESARQAAPLSVALVTAANALRGLAAAREARALEFEQSARETGG